ERLAWGSVLRGAPLPWPHPRHGSSRAFPLPITWGGGQGVRPTREQATGSSTAAPEPARHHGTQVEMPFTTIARSPPESTPSVPPGPICVHLRNLRSATLIPARPSQRRAGSRSSGHDYL